MRGEACRTAPQPHRAARKALAHACHIASRAPLAEISQVLAEIWQVLAEISCAKVDPAVDMAKVPRPFPVCVVCSAHFS